MPPSGPTDGVHLWVPQSGAASLQVSIRLKGSWSSESYGGLDREHLFDNLCFSNPFPQKFAEG